ncbi:unnamed protein product [Urochloa humidicola]
MAAVAHVLLFPWPLQGHMNPMPHLAAVLLDAGLHVTFALSSVTHHNARRLALAGALCHHPHLRLLSIPDCLSSTSIPAPWAASWTSSTHSMRTAGMAAFRVLLRDGTLPLVACVVADGVMAFAIDAAEEARVPAVAFRMESPCGFLAYLSVPRGSSSSARPPPPPTSRCMAPRVWTTSCTGETSRACRAATISRRPRGAYRRRHRRPLRRVVGGDHASTLPRPWTARGHAPRAAAPGGGVLRDAHRVEG